jgi:hypothetical protein
VDDTNGKSVFYLQGMVGTDKSTISRTVAQHLVERADRPLVATFFFKRGEGDRGNASRVIPTLTSQLISKNLFSLQASSAPSTLIMQSLAGRWENSSNSLFLRPWKALSQAN